MKNALPINEFVIGVFVSVVRLGQKPSFARLGGFVGLSVEDVRCPDSILVKFAEEEGTSVEVKDQFGAKLGFFDLIYRVNVTEAQAQ